MQYLRATECLHLYIKVVRVVRINKQKTETMYCISAFKWRYQSECFIINNASLAKEMLFKIQCEFGLQLSADICLINVIIFFFSVERID